MSANILRLSSQNDYFSLANPNPNRKRRNLGFHFGRSLFQSKFSASRGSSRPPPLYHVSPIKFRFTDGAALPWLISRLWLMTLKRLFEGRKSRQRRGKSKVTIWSLRASGGSC